MYHAIVRKKVKHSFQQLSLGSYHAATDLMHPQCEYQFIGQHALAGHKKSRATISLWFERFLRVLPHFQFKPSQIIVSGWPWHTDVVTKLDVHWQKPDGSLYQNTALQLTTLKWFKAVHILTIDDTLNFSKLLDEVAEKYGVAEAKAAPIEG